MFSSKFQHHGVLSEEVRLQISGAALFSPIRGTITQLSGEFSITRPTIYKLRDRLAAHVEGLFAVPEPHSTADEMHESWETILILRMIGKCPIEAISQIMKIWGLPYGSVGYISQFLRMVGENLPSTVNCGKTVTLAVVFASDEVFSGRRPILITVDPVSSAILRIELSDSRSSARWQNHWEKLEENDCFALYVVSDEGKGLQAAQARFFPGLKHQPDTFHAVAHQFGLWDERLGKAAFKAIGYEYEQEALLKSAKGEQVCEKRLKAYYEAKAACDQKIQLYDNFCFLYYCLLESLQIFDANGRVNKPSVALENIRTAFELLKSLNHNEITRQAMKTEKLLPDLLNFLPRAEALCEQLRHDYPAGVLEAFCVTWQANKNKIKSKKTPNRHFHKGIETSWFAQIQDWLKEDFQESKKRIYSQLDTIVQSSSLVETINSIVRSYLNTSKNQVSQHLLNLIMFYHNHRRYMAGKRKGSIPMELLTGKKQDKHWLELLLDQIPQMIQAKDSEIAA